MACLDCCAHNLWCLCGTWYLNWQQAVVAPSWSEAEVLSLLVASPNRAQERFQGCPHIEMQCAMQFMSGLSCAVVEVVSITKQVLRREASDPSQRLKNAMTAAHHVTFGGMSKHVKTAVFCDSFKAMFAVQIWSTGDPSSADNIMTDDVRFVDLLWAEETKSRKEFKAMIESFFKVGLGSVLYQLSCAGGVHIFTCCLHASP